MKQSDYFKVIKYKKVGYLISAFRLKQPEKASEKYMKSTLTAETAVQKILKT